MFKTGIYTVDQLKNLKSLKTFIGKDKNISITLYNDIVRDEHYSGLAEKVLFEFQDINGVFKRTYSLRFEKFDFHTIQEITKIFPSEETLTIHDTAVSDGRTAYDLFKKLCVYFPKMQFYASDYNIYIFIIKIGHTTIVLDQDGTILEVVFPPFVFTRAPSSLFYPLNHLVRFIIEKTIVKYILAQYKSGALKPQKISLVNPETLRLTEEDDRFHLLQYSLLDESPLSHPINVIRAMNILNPSYFTPQQFTNILQNIYNSLSKNGLFVVGSNQESNSIVHGGMFQKTGTGFKKIYTSGEGPPIEQNILNFQSAT